MKVNVPKTFKDGQISVALKLESQGEIDMIAGLMGSVVETSLKRADIDLDEWYLACITLQSVREQDLRVLAIRVVQ